MTEINYILNYNSVILNCNISTYYSFFFFDQTNAALRSIREHKGGKKTKTCPPKIWNDSVFSKAIKIMIKGDLLCKNHFYKVFEHSCVAAECENNQPINVKNPPTHFLLKSINHKQSPQANNFRFSLCSHHQGKKSLPFVTLSALLA